MPENISKQIIFFSELNKKKKQKKCSDFEKISATAHIFSFDKKDSALISTVHSIIQDVPKIP